MSSPWGVQASGFVRKPLSAIIQSLNDATQQIPNYAQADVSLTSPLGKYNALVAGPAIDEVWGLAATAYAGVNRDQSVGAQTDSLGAISGSLRLPPKGSSVYCLLRFSQSGTYPAGSLIANVSGQPSVQFTNATEIVVPVMNPPITGTNTYATPAPGVVFVSVEDGPLQAPALSLTQISVAVQGWVAITNAADASLGNLLEQDPAYKVRQVEEIAAVGATQAQALEAVLLEVPHVISVRVLENTQLVADPVTAMPPKSFQVLIYADPSVDWTQVSQVIWNEKPAGMESFGTTWPAIAPIPFVQLDSQQNDVSARVQWTPMTEVQLYLRCIVLFSPGITANAQKTSVALQLALNLANLGQGFDPNGNTLPIGSPGILVPGGAPGLLPGPPPVWQGYGFVYWQPYVRAMLQTPGILDVASFSFATPGPVPTVLPVNLTTIALGQIPTISTATGRLIVSELNGAVWHS